MTANKKIKKEYLYTKCLHFIKAKENKEKECDGAGIWKPECKRCPYCKF